MDKDKFLAESANMGYAIILKLVRLHLAELKEFVESHKKNKTTSKGDNEKNKQGDIAWEATIISLIILLETNLREFLEDYQDNRDLKISYKDLNGDILNKFKLYGQKVLDLKFDFKSDLWQYIIGLKELRNCFIHNDGWLDGFQRRKVVEDFARRESTIEIDENGFINVSYNTCTNASNEIDRFFVSICKIGTMEFPGQFEIENDKNYSLPIIE